MIKFKQSWSIIISINIHIHIQITKMWQKILTSSTAPCPSDGQTYTWNYGTITISNNYKPSFEHLLSQSHPSSFSSSPSSSSNTNSLLITTDPFTTTLLPSLPISVQSRVLAIPSNESTKSMQTVLNLCSKFMQKNINKQSTIYVLGGGMLLDLCGFAAAIYMRGVKKVVYIPTTLLAIVDATVGGKTGVNFNGVKNVLGVVKHAQEIWISLHYLESLSDRQFSNGLAEVVKMAVTHSAELFKLLADKNTTIKSLRQNTQNNNLLLRIIKHSLQIKTKVVQKDQFDKNQRNWLNFGHTVGHAIQMNIESTYHFHDGSQLTHGECVAIGMLIEIGIGELIGEVNDFSIYKNVRKILEKFNLPVEIPTDTNIDKLIKLMTKDKKNTTANTIQFALIDQIGQRKLKMTPATIQAIQQYFTKQVSLQFSQTSLSSLKQSIEKTNKNWQKLNKFPSSKSLSIRYLYLAALSYLKHKKQVLILNFLQSQDTKFMIQSLESLGFYIKFVDENSAKVCGFEQRVEGKLNVGNSGLTARFILPLCAYLKGTWHISCHQRMSSRPNQQIFKFCKQHYKCSYKFQPLKQNCFPVTITSQRQQIYSQQQPINITLESQQSSQYISSVLLNSYLWDFGKGRSIRVNIPNGKIVSESYVLMTLNCLKIFGITAKLNKNQMQNSVKDEKSVNFIQLQKLTDSPPPSTLVIERDLSSFSYPYALALIHDAPLPQFSLQSNSQGDVKFYKFCQSLMTNSLPSSLQFSDCTDTFMTMAAILSTNINNRFKIQHQNITIHGIANQRVKQSNRIQLIRVNFGKIGVQVKEIQDGIVLDGNIKRFKQFGKGEIVIFQTGGDHRIAMSMALVVSFLLTIKQIRNKQVKFVIDDKNAVNKTFPYFWNYLKDAGMKQEYIPNLYQKISKQSINHQQKQSQQYLTQPQYPNLSRTVLLGNRGCGKSTISRLISSNPSYTSSNQNITVVDLDQQITKQIIQQSQYKTITDFVENKGWEQFRKLEYKILQKFVYSKHLQQSMSRSSGNGRGQREIVIATGGGVVDWSQSIKLIKQNKTKSITKVYIQKQFKDLIVVLNDKRPYIPNFQQICKTRSTIYRQIADKILTIPPLRGKNNRNQYDYIKINQFIVNQFKILKNNRNNSSTNNSNNNNNGGFIYCVPQLYQHKNNNDGFEIMNWNENDEEFYFKKLKINGKQQSPYQKQQKVIGIELRIDSIINQQLNVKQNQYLNLNTNKNTNTNNPINDTQFQNDLHYLCRKSIAQFKIANNPIIKDLLIILTLRSQNQFGLFPFQNNEYIKNNNNRLINDYWRWIHHLHKIPSSYIDIQYAKLATRPQNYQFNYPMPPQSYIYSYHGSDKQIIQQFMSKSTALKHASPFQLSNSSHSIPFSNSNSNINLNLNPNANLIKLCYKNEDQIWQQNHKNWRQHTDISINLSNPLSRLENKYKMIRRQKDVSGIINIPSKGEIRMIKAISKFFK